MLETLFGAGQGTLTVPFSIDFFSIVVGVITGALFACHNKLDIVGTTVCGLLTAYGGGIIRDLLLQTHGVYFMQNPGVILICIVICIFVFYFRGIFNEKGALFFFADALSVALFALSGANKAFECGVGAIMVVILGGITSVGGGTLRDICVGHVPSVFRQSNYYAVAGLAGALIFAAIAYSGLSLVLAGIACVVVTVLLRYLSVHFNWTTSADPQLARGVSRKAQSISHVFSNLIHKSAEEGKREFDLKRESGSSFARRHTRRK